jgi:hypothetical protein
MLIFLCFLFACNSNEHSKQSQFQMLSDTSRYLGVSDHELHQRLTDALLLPRLDHGVDSFELRVWKEMAIVDLNFVTIVSFKNSSWHLSETTYWKQFTDDIRNFKIDSLETRWFTPKISNQAIVDSVTSFRLDTIPTQWQTPNFRNRTADGSTYVIEIATKRFYKRLSYSNPKIYQEVNHQKIMAFLNFCSRNFNFATL